MDSMVSIKGIGEGVKLVLSPEAPFRNILDELYHIVRANRKFFDGDADIYITGRTLEPADKLRLESVMNTLFPGHKIIYGAPMHKKGLTPRAREAYKLIHHDDEHKTAFPKDTEDLEKMNSEKQNTVLTEFLKNAFRTVKEGAQEPAEPQEQQEWEYLSVEHTVKTEFYRGDIKKGQIVRVEGNLLIEGNVLCGGVAQASGNIFVMGSLQGIAWAGAAGDDKAYILVLDCMPMQLRIAGYIRNVPCQDLSIRHRIKKIYVKEHELQIEPYEGFL